MEKNQNKNFEQVVGLVIKKRDQKNKHITFPDFYEMMRRYLCDPNYRKTFLNNIHKKNIDICKNISLVPICEFREQDFLKFLIHRKTNSRLELQVLSLLKVHCLIILGRTNKAYENLQFIDTQESFLQSYKLYLSVYIGSMRLAEKGSINVDDLLCSIIDSVCALDSNVPHFDQIKETTYDQGNYHTHRLCIILAPSNIQTIH